jgi:glycosyltransferase involved in cell wall biosynthesis
VSHTKDKVSDLESLGFIHAHGVRTDKNRNVILKQALEMGADYILWLDADMVFPHDIIVKFLETPVDVVGCLYFKRSYPFDPIGYVKGTNPLKPFRCLNPDMIKDNTLLTVDGLGFGGTMVKMDVYRSMGDEMWMNYDSGFHLPFDNEHSLTHDLMFCRKAQEYGYKIHLHTGVRPGHIAERIITDEDWRNVHDEQRQQEKKIIAIMPTIHPKQAKKTAKILESRAGYPFKRGICWHL